MDVGFGGPVEVKKGAGVKDGKSGIENSIFLCGGG
jgi:hypothetical protein